jgi:large subunit ribosomal protein L22
MAKRTREAEGGPVYRAVHRFCRMSVHKVRPVIDLVRGLDAGEAREVLKYTRKRAALYIDRVLLSAMANAQQAGADVQDLVIDEISADGGPQMRRWKAGPHGRARPILKRRSHVQVVLRPR